MIIAVLVNCPPKVMQNTIDLDKDFIEKPSVTELLSTFLDLVTISTSKLKAPIPDRFVANGDPSGGKKLLYITET